MEWRHREATADLNEVPGVGPATIQKLAAVGVYNSYQLFAKYLSFREDKPGEPMSTVTHNDIFWYWLKDAGITSHRSAIVRVSTVVSVDVSRCKNSHWNTVLTSWISFCRPLLKSALRSFPRCTMRTFTRMKTTTTMTSRMHPWGK